jgi:hypothetical protein
MSAHQMVCHLADAFRMALGTKEVRLDAGLLQRTIVKGFALYVPLAWPEGRLRTSPELDQDHGGTRPADFASDKAEAERLLQEITRGAAALQRTHPVFGPLSRAAWLRWGYLHTDHHLRQFGA